MRPLTAQSGKGLTACPAESEHPGAEINHFQEHRSYSNMFYKTFSGKKKDYYWHIRMGFVYNEEYDSSRE
ncbi:hypothetical protein [Fictibacillus sp. UD]|uniref:hypothetical protein n=1 Tax=Fictibacillus sp. UD TaxID=3038777 RepID=UPI003749C95D